MVCCLAILTDHGVFIVHMGKTIAQKDANVLKDCTRHKAVYATAVGDITKTYFILILLLLNILNI